MNLALHMSKNYNVKDYLKSSYIRIAVIDLDISNEYPSNFVCILPKTINPNAKLKNKFQKKYGSDSEKIIRKLLNQALKTTDDQDIKKELLERLKILNPKPKNMIKCRICGKDFQARKFKFRRQKTCFECKAKSYLNSSE